MIISVRIWFSISSCTSLSTPIINYILTLILNHIIMEDDITLDIHSETFNKDLDEIGWDPIKIDDSDDKSKELFGY